MFGVGSDIAKIGARTVYPDAQGKFTLTQEQYIASQRDEITEIETAPQEERQANVFSRGLNGEFDLNNLFGTDVPLFANPDEYTTVKDIQSRVNAGTASQDDVSMLDALAGPGSKARSRFNYHAQTTDGAKLAKGITSTGTLPLDSITGKVIIPSGDVTNPYIDMEAALQAKAESSKKIFEWMQTRPDAPQDKNITDAIFEALSTTGPSVFAERVYNLGAATVELGHWATIAWQGVTGFGDENDVGSYPDDLDSAQERRVALEKFRASGDWLNNRRVVIEDMIREQLRVKLSPIEMEKYDKKITLENGDEVYAVRIVGDQFAEALSEEMFDTQGWKTKLGQLILENNVAYQALKAPFTVVQSANRTIRRAVHGNRVAKSLDEDPSQIPFNIMTKEERQDAIAQRARINHVRPEIAAAQLVDESTNFFFFDNTRKNILLGRLNRDISKAQFTNATDAGKEKVLTLRKRIIAERSKPNPNKATLRSLTRNITLEVERQNWRMVQGSIAGAREYGIDPYFDTVMALTQLAGREFFNGPIGEAYGAAGALASVVMYRTFNLNRMTLPLTTTVSNFSYAAKRGTEELINLPFLLTKIKPELSASARGLLVNPNIRSFLRLDPNQTAQFGLAFQNSILRFKKGLDRLPLPVQDMMVNNLQATFDTVNEIAKLIPADLTYTTAAGKTVVARDQFAKSLSLGFGEASGLNFFIAAAKATEGSQAQSAISKVNASVREALGTQQLLRQKQGNLTKALEMLNEDIQGLKTVLKDPNLPVPRRTATQEAVSRLEDFAKGFEDEITNATSEYSRMLSRHRDVAQKQLEILANPLNQDLATDAIQSGAVDKLLDLIRHVERESLKQTDNPTVSRTDADGEVYSQPLATAPQVAIDELLFKGKAIDADYALVVLREAVLKAGKASIMTADEATVLSRQNNLVLNMFELRNAQNDNLIKTAYEAISTKETIPLNVFATDLIGMFKAMVAEEGLSIAVLANPYRIEGMGKAGKDMMTGLQKGARLGLVQLFSDPNILEELSKLKGAPEAGFSNADDVINWFKREFYADGSLDRVRPDGLTHRAAMQLGEGQDISDLHLALYMIDDNLVPFSARNLNFLVSPYDLELLKQGTNKLRNTAGESAGAATKRQVGQNVGGIIDQTFLNWANGLNAEDFNQVVRARVMARLSAQGTDAGTVGAKLEKMIPGKYAAQIDPNAEGGITTATTGSPSSTLDPVIDAILAPNTSTDFNGEIQKLIKTFAPFTDTLPSFLLKQGVDGKFIVPTDKEIAQAVSSDMSQDTFDTLSALLNAKIRERVVAMSGLDKYRTKLSQNATDNTIPRIDTKDMPQAIQIPPRYNNNLEEYLDDVVNNSKVSVNGKTKTLLDIDSFMLNDITEVVNASATFQRVHFSLVEDAKLFNVDLGADLKTLESNFSRILQEANLSKGATTGEGFHTNILKSSNANATINYINRVTSPEFLTRSNMSQDQVQSSLQGVMEEVLRHVGGVTVDGGPKVLMFDGTRVTVEAFESPQYAWELLDAAVEGTSQVGKNFRRIADAAGVTEDQLISMRHVFRYGTMLKGSRLVDDLTNVNIQGGVKPFSMDNALSKAFNIARGMVSKEYVAAEVALRYGALGKGKTLNLMLTDPKAADILYNLLTDSSKVDETKALYLARQIMKSAAGDKSLTAYFEANLNQDDLEYAKQYWENVGVNHESTGILNIPN